MKRNITKLKPWLVASILLALTPVAQATCYKVTSIGKTTRSIPQEVADLGYTAKNWGGVFATTAASISFGTIIMGTAAQSIAPAGTVLAVADLPILEKGQKVSYSANQIVFKCDLSDADDIYEIYALPGVSGEFYGGKEVSDVEHGYQTPSKSIAYRIFNQRTGLYYTNSWQERKLTEEDYVVIGSKIYIPASAFDSATFELVKSELDFGIVRRNAFGLATSAQGYVTLRTPTINNNAKTGSLANSPEKSDHSVAVWTMGGGTTNVIHGNNCTLGDFDQVVNLPPITVSDLENDVASTKTFNISIDCNAGAISGTTPDDDDAPVAVGFLVSPSAKSKASELKLENSSGGISYLLDDNYGANGVASGVGIRIYSSGTSALNLLSSSTDTGTGNTAGWYGFADLMNVTGINASGGMSYAGSFTASLEQIPGLTVKTGSVNAQAQIIVSLQ
ncbi:fimbrial protein [Pantoea sp. EKM101V]|uniref:fimbrial protein n=1 Tax=Pantoea sp. EKM101V TaxID=1683695 RepID=UPI00142D6CBE|nr:fimbrial protein [Pantoea sp. EKM101V]KAF6661926.1 fimbrial protein [Pantoea sp. EKM101V]